MFSTTKYLLLIITIILQFIEGNGHSCQTRGGEQGICGSLESCYGLCMPISLLPPDSKKVRDHLSRYACTENGKTLVCCPERFQPPQRTAFPYDPKNHGHFEMLPHYGQHTLSFDRIVFGYEAPLNTFTFMALLQYNTPSGLKFQCGGSIINDRYILTAAHCVRPEDNLVSVRVGEHNIVTEVDCSDTDDYTDLICADPVQNLEIEGIVPHGDYNNPNMANDIALIRLKTSIDFSKNNVNPIYLPTTIELQTRNFKNYIIAGWGVTEKNVPSNVLMAASVPVKPMSECERLFPTYTFFDWEICAAGGTGSSTPDSNTCRGDSGGPVFQYEIINSYPQPIQFGIVAAVGFGCGGKSRTTPSIYTNVPYYIKWILDNMHP